MSFTMLNPELPAVCLPIPMGLRAVPQGTGWIPGEAAEE
jgi:hypothetical protein